MSIGVTAGAPSEHALRGDFLVFGGRVAWEEDEVQGEDVFGGVEALRGDRGGLFHRERFQGRFDLTDIAGVWIGREAMAVRIGVAREKERSEGSPNGLEEDLESLLAPSPHVVEGGEGMSE
jgi:hypothetical protein